MAIALPYECKSLRMPTVDMPRTSTIVARDQMTLTCTTVTTPGWSSGDLLVAFYGQPGRALMYSGTNVPAGGYYAISFSETSTGFDKASNIWFPFCGNGGPVGTGTFGVDTYWPILGATTSNPDATPHGPNLPVGVSRGVNYVWLNSSDSITLIGAGTAASFPTGILECQVFQWESADTAPTVAFEGYLATTSGVLFGSITVGPFGAGYYAFRFGTYTISAGTVTNSAGFTMRVNCNSPIGWRMTAMSAIDPANSGDSAIGVSARVVGTSLLLTNTTSILNRQGTVLAARVREAEPMNMTPAILQRAAEKYTGQAAEGVYTFKEFTNYSEQFRRSVATAIGGIGTLQFDLDFNDYYHFIQITCPAASTSANTYTVSTDFALEFQTEVERYSRDVSPYDYSALIEARRLINSRPVWFYENPLHMSDIYGFIKRGVRAGVNAVGAYAPKAARFASMIDPPRAAGYEVLGHMLSQLKMR